MYYVRAQGVDERMINVHYFNYYPKKVFVTKSVRLSSFITIIMTVSSDYIYSDIFYLSYSFFCSSYQHSPFIRLFPALESSGR